MELNPASLKLPTAVPTTALPADPPGSQRPAGSGETPAFAANLAQWMSARGGAPGANPSANPNANPKAAAITAASPETLLSLAGILSPATAPVAEEIVAGSLPEVETESETESDEPAPDPTAMFWLALGLPASARAPAHATPAASTHAAVTVPAPGPDGSESGGGPELPSHAARAAHPSPAMPSMPILPDQAAPAAESALTKAFTQHIERFASAEVAGSTTQSIVEAAVPAPRTGEAPVPLGAVPVIERLAAMSAGLAPAPVIDPRLAQAPQQIAETVVWNLGKGAQEVQIKLHPEDLGPLEVSVKLDGDRVAVRFDMADASVRDVVQSSLSSLATLLSARGLALDQAQVFTQQGRGQPHMPVPQTQRNSDDVPAEFVQAPRLSLRRGLVDDYV